MWIPKTAAEELERLLAELDEYVDKHVPWPEYGSTVGHPRAVEASFEFVNFLSWLRAIDERLDRRHRPRRQEPRAGLLPALADRPLRSRVATLVATFRADALERALANYAMHTAAVPQPYEGVPLSRDHSVSLRVPDRPNEQVSTRWHLTFEEERDGLAVAREAAQAVVTLVDGLIDAFTEETRSIQQKRKDRENPAQPDSEAAVLLR